MGSGAGARSSGESLKRTMMLAESLLQALERTSVALTLLAVAMVVALALTG